MRSHRQRVLQVVAENDVLDQHGFDLDTPARRDILDDLADRLRDFFPALDHILQNAGAHHLAKRGLSALDKRLSDIGDTERSLVRGDDVVVDNGGQVQRDIVLGHADLAGDLDDLDLDIHGGQTFAQGIHFDQTRINRALKAVIAIQSVPLCEYKYGSAAYRPNFEIKPTSPWFTGLNGLGQQQQQGMAPKHPINSPKL